MSDEQITLGIRPEPVEDETPVDENSNPRKKPRHGETSCGCRFAPDDGRWILACPEHWALGLRTRIRKRKRSGDAL